MTLRHSPTGRIVLVLWDAGAWQGVSGARYGLGHEGGAVQESEGGGDKRRERAVGKAYLAQGRAGR